MDGWCGGAMRALGAGLGDISRGIACGAGALACGDGRMKGCWSLGWRASGRCMRVSARGTVRSGMGSLTPPFALGEPPRMTGPGAEGAERVKGSSRALLGTRPLPLGMPTLGALGCDAFGWDAPGLCAPSTGARWRISGPGAAL
ncbi:MAG: hypothetical protein U1F33_11240, partial [Alphaproteobacteria bacterium]